MLVAEFGVASVGPDVVGNCAEHANSHSEKRETALTGRPTPSILIHYRERSYHEMSAVVVNCSL